jgi:uncharacterized protein (DUF1697 family)
MKSICLLRAVNVGGRKVVMSELAAMAAGMGFKDVKTVLASGNLILEGGDLGSDRLEKALEAEFEKRFGFHAEFICRTAAEWRALMDACPFPEDAKTRGNRLLVLVAQGSPAPDAVAKIEARATLGERVARVGDDLWIAFTDAGMADSKTGQAMKALGCPVTGRNWNTVEKLAALAQA